MGEADNMKSEFDREVLNHFSTAVRRHFSWLLSDFGFVVFESQIHVPDVWVILRNRTTQVMIDYEWGVGCWVSIGRLTPWLKRVPEEYSLEDIAEAVDPATRFPDVSSPEYDFERVDEALQKLASVVSSKAANLLRGDFSTFARIKARAT